MRHYYQEQIDKFNGKVVHYDYNSYTPYKWDKLLKQKHLINGAIFKKIYGKYKIDKGEGKGREALDSDASEDSPNDPLEDYYKDVGQGNPNGSDNEYLGGSNEEVAAVLHEAAVDLSVAAWLKQTFWKRLIGICKGTSPHDNIEIDDKITSVREHLLSEMYDGGEE